MEQWPGAGALLPRVLWKPKGSIAGSLVFKEAMREGSQESVTGAMGPLLCGGRSFHNTLPVVTRKVENVPNEPSDRAEESPKQSPGRCHLVTPCCLEQNVTERDKLKEGLLNQDLRLGHKRL